MGGENTGIRDDVKLMMLEGVRFGGADIRLRSIRDCVPRGRILTMRKLPLFVSVGRSKSWEHDF